MFAKLNIKNLQTAKEKNKTAVTNFVKKKTANGCKTCGKNR